MKSPRFVLSALALVLSSAVQAYGPPPGYQGGYHGQQRPHQAPPQYAQRPQQRQMTPEQAMEQMNKIKEKLAITSAQEPAWNDFVASMQAQSKRMQEHAQAMREHMTNMKTKSAIEMMDMREKMMGERLQDMQGVHKHMRAMYEQLNAEQRKQADQIMSSGLMR